MSQTVEIPYAAYRVRQDLKPQGLEGLSQAMIDQHWKLYDGYVTNTNLLNKLIWDALEGGRELNNPQFAEQQRRLGFEYNGMVLHEYYFGALRKGAGPEASSPLVKKIAEDFGGFDRWKKQFVEIGKMRGVGWVILNYDPSLKRLNNFWVTDHEIGNIAGFTPVAVMDVWEHAYVTDYGAAGRAAYMDAYFKNLDWGTLNARYETAAAQQPSR